MATSAPIKERIKSLREEYDRLKTAKDGLLQLIDEAEIPESVYNSNAIENSTLSLQETEKILLEMEVSRDISLREVFEAKNLARVMEYVRGKAKVEDLTAELILRLHQMLISNIDEKIAGRWRREHEYVRVGTHIAPAPEHINQLLKQQLLEYSSNYDLYFVDNVAKFHLDFEIIHPFLDGNGRIGRVIMNYQLFRLGFPGIMVRDKEKKDYYRAFTQYLDDKKTKTMERIISLVLMESLHKRIAYLKGEAIIPLTDYAKQQEKPSPVILNAARRQTIPAFREKGVWKIGVK